MQLIDIGWDEDFQRRLESLQPNGLAPARVVKQNRLDYVVWGEIGELTSELSGRYRHAAVSKSDLPAVGDWVAVAARAAEGRGTIHGLVPRRSAFVRKVAGVVTAEQVVAANIDTAFIVVGLDGNFNLRRIERYLALAWESGASPVVILNKSDLCADSEEHRLAVESVAPGVEVHLTSAASIHGIDALSSSLVRGKTAVFLGSSGVGKSSIINRLIGDDRLKVGEVSEADSRGRHTTTFRELILLPNGGIVIDTPGMRELQVWGDEDGLRQAFEDIEQLAAGCRFRDCTHTNEPGCAALEAISAGVLEQNRLDSYLKLKKEMRYLVSRQSMKASAVEKARWKAISQRVKKWKSDA
jgi:ribosome biogenesis GTPase